VEAFYFVLGKSDAYVITEAPNNAAAALATTASGGATVKATVFLTAHQVIKSCDTKVKNRPPGH
jgi:uncharacterized protein with GYD domain